MRTMALAMRHALTPAVVLFWLVMVGLLVHKQAPPPSAPEAPLAAGTTPERDEWFGVERDGKRVGRAHRASARTVTGLRFTDDLRARVWLTPDGSVLREEGSLGLTLVRESREAALAGDAALVPLDLVSASRIPVAGRIEDPRHVSRLTLRMQGAAAARVPLDPPRQRVRGDLLRVEREPLPEHAPLGAADAALAQYLAPAPFIESDDAAIVATARTIVGSGRDATAAAHALVAWVNEHLEQAPSVTVPSAREVLAARRGDCNEQAVLLAALARAAGIPARVVAGAIYLDGAFYYHAWTELWLGTWVSADAVFRQLPTDATHVKLLEGGPERHMELAGIVGELRFTAEESQR